MTQLELRLIGASDLSGGVEGHAKRGDRVMGATVL